MWKKHTIEPDKNYKLSLGELEVLIKKTGKAWHFKSEINKALEDNNFAPANEHIVIPDHKVFIADKNNSLSILPALPDKPLLIRPKSEFKLQPKSSIQLKLQIPIWVQLYHGHNKLENLIHEAPAKVLSKTWLGEPDNGQLAYALRIHPGNEEPSAVYCATCPIRITNDSSSILDFQRFLLEADQLTLYLADEKIYTNNVQVKFKGENTISDVHYSSNKPETIENAQKIAEPRNPEKRGALKRSFFFIKSLTQY